MGKPTCQSQRVPENISLTSSRFLSWSFLRVTTLQKSGCVDAEELDTEFFGARTVKCNGRVFYVTADTQRFDRPM